MRSRPRKFANFSINTGGQSSFWQALLELQSSFVCTAFSQFVRKFGGELSLKLLQLVDCIFGLDYLLVMVWTI
jgi:hypothetical protein